VLRLARFNARIDMVEQPHKSAGFLTGVPAPVGAGLAFLPMYLWINNNDLTILRDARLVGAWLVLIAFLMISNVATLSWSSLRPRRAIRLEILALSGLTFAALLSDPWLTLAGICVLYAISLPFGIFGYARVKRQRALRNAAPEPTL
jgi:CDP-diacylglycerol--serine O-phosphatidyltransferase